ncbi:MAG: ferric reductase-like transmembrane domain-containing protein [Acidimicrobiia bacterium]
MTAHVWWYVARASGVVAAALVAAAVIWGLLLSTRVLQDRPRPAWLLDLHRMLGGLSLAFVAVHLAALVADTYVHFGVADLLVPFASDWRPGPVALGILALYLLAAVELTSLAMRKLPRRWWHGIHMSSYVCFWLVAIHGAAAGTDASNPLLRWGSVAAIVVVTGLTLYRVVAGRRARRKRAVAPGRSPAGAAALQSTLPNRQAVVPPLPPAYRTPAVAPPPYTVGAGATTTMTLKPAPPAGGRGRTVEL